MINVKTKVEWDQGLKMIDTLAMKTAMKPPK
jgi:hypothetical protein